LGLFQMTNLVNQGDQYKYVEAALEATDFSVNPMDIPVFVQDRSPLDQLIADCEWMYYKFFEDHQGEVEKRPDFVEETRLVWMYERLNHVFKIDMGVTNFNMLHEISYGLHGKTENPEINLGFIKYSDIMWIEQNIKLNPEHRNYFAYSGKHNCKDQVYDYEKNGENIWFYHTHFPFWNNVPKFFSQKHGAHREFRVWRDEKLEKACKIITDFEKLFIDSGIPIRHSLLVDLGINDLVYRTDNKYRPDFGKEWKEANNRWGFRIDEV